MKRIKIISLLLVCIIFICNISQVIYAEEVISESNIQINSALDEKINMSISYIEAQQELKGGWGEYGKLITADICNVLEYLYLDKYKSGDLLDVLDNASIYFYNENILNTDDLSRYLLLDDLYDEEHIYLLIDSQNLDGGFGIDKGYTSDIIDTKLALKTLADLGETEAMTKAAIYIASLQNDDGGFAYQQGLASNAELTAEIADILADCINENQYLSYTLSNTISKLNEFLDNNSLAIDELSADNLSGVYQHFHTALFKLKTTGQYDVTPYYDLQNEDGGVFDDPMATALFLELIVREQNTLTASMDYISITNDKGYAVSSFNANENVNIEIGSDYETEKAYMQVSIETPNGGIISLDSENLVWNTGDYEEGAYTVKAEIIRYSNHETVASLTQTFRIEHNLSFDSVSLSLSQRYSRVGDEDKVSIYAYISLQNFSEESDNVTINLNIKSAGEIISSKSKAITEADLVTKKIQLGDFIPDTSEKRSYIITAEVVSNDLVVAQSTTNYFVSDKGVAILKDVNKDYLYEASDNAEINIQLRDERVVDLIFTTSSENTALITQYADQIEKIKNDLEGQGYVVNLCSVETSYLTAKDTFAWIEYDHPNYDTQSPYTKHIIYEEDNIKMTGYVSVPYKDFLLVPDTNDSQKLFTFDIQRDSTDWHSMYGGGFLFNTVIEDDTISGYYVLITAGGLRLYSLDRVNLNSFRNSSTAGTLLNTFSFSNPYDEHHIKISADNTSLSLWDGETIVIDNYELPQIYGNGYGPITSHDSHNCSQRSYFTFANITMQTITGEKLYDILDNYNFESQNSRYVINLSDKSIDDFDTEEEIDEVAQKVIDKNITFIGLGNDANEIQYKSLIDSIADSGIYYDFSDEATQIGLHDYIISSEEKKRIKIDDQIIATDLIFIGTVDDETIFVQTFDKLCVGETIEFIIPMELINLTVGMDSVLFKDITLKYTDENGVYRSVDAGNITLPVITPNNKITSSVSTDQSEYSSNQDVIIFDRIHNTFENKTAKNLINVITVQNEDNEVVSEYTLNISEIMPNGYVERQEVWNTTNYASGVYTVSSKVYDGDLLVAQSTTDITVTVPEIPKVDLVGELVISDKKFDTNDTITINTSIQNVGYTDIVNGQVLIKVIDTSTQKEVYEYETPLNLGISEVSSESISFTPEINFSSMKGEEYLVTYEVILQDGRIIPLAGDGFILDGITVTIYFIDNTQQKWVNNDNAIMELVDNTYGHDRYEMTKLDDETWAVQVPASAYNITFNRYDSTKTIQWNSWSAGGRDENNAYYADVAEHGHWGYVDGSALENYFHEGDIVYLDLSGFTSWENDNAIMYVNFSDASKVENGGSDVNIEAYKNSDIYNPQVIDYEVAEHIYAYVVTKEDEGKNILRFWRGNEDALWNCSVTLDYEQYKLGNNCAKVTGWNSQGYLNSKS